MRWIDYANKTPADDDTPGWTPWSDEQWKSWLADSAKHLGELKSREAAGDRERRNKYIDDNSAHWGKLKPWLLALSHGKCWFTEGKELCSHLEVEHFRPKKVAKSHNKPERDGYWWLAFEYANFRIAGNVPNRKKGGWFPLHKDSGCSIYDAQCEESEACYLLDPTSQADVQLLAFDEEGNAIPAPGCDDWEKERVVESVERFKLNAHDTLPHERRKVWQKASRAIDGFLTAKAAYKPGINPAPKATMEEQVRTLKEMLQPDTELSAVAAWCVQLRNEKSLLGLVVR